MNLKSIAEEEADCRAAFAGVSVGAFILHCHHHILMELLLEPAEYRVDYILRYKPKTEQALRLRLFRPLLPKYVSTKLAKVGAKFVEADAEFDKADAELDKAKADAEFDKAAAKFVEARAEWDEARAEWNKAGYHAAICPDCPWDGSTIFQIGRAHV